MSDVKCRDCGKPLFETDGVRPPCPACGSTRRAYAAQISGHVALSMKAQGVLTSFIDTSSRAAEQATTTALREIALWVETTDRLTVKHVIAGSQSAFGAGAPAGPFKNDQLQTIVGTVFDNIEARRSERWERTKTVITWLFSVASLILAALGFRLAYLKFFG